MNFVDISRKVETVKMLLRLKVPTVIFMLTPPSKLCEPKPAQIISSARSGYDGKNWEGLMKRNYMEVLYLSTSDSSSTVLK
jgi:hypothetical protein